MFSTAIGEARAPAYALARSVFPGPWSTGPKSVKVTTVITKRTSSPQSSRRIV